MSGTVWVLKVGPLYLASFGGSFKWDRAQALEFPSRATARAFARDHRARVYPHRSEAR